MLSLAQRFVGSKEVPGAMSNPIILAMLKLDLEFPEDDSVPWCSAFVNWICWLVRFPRSKSLRARSWLNVGRGIELGRARPGDVVVFQRGSGPQPGADVIKAPGHVGFYVGMFGEFIEVLGGNQSDSVKVSRYHVGRLLSVRRLT